MCYYLYELSLESPGESSPLQKGNTMMDLAMVITTVAIMYLTTWSLHSHDKMSGVVPLILAVIATALLVMELAAYAVVILPRTSWMTSAAVFSAVITLFVTCALARVNGRSKLLRDKSR